MSRALVDVEEERSRQDAKWGVQQHDPPDYFAILSEEVGEVAELVVEWRFGREADREARLRLMREELVQTAAVAVAMVEEIDRRLGPC